MTRDIPTAQSLEKNDRPRLAGRMCVTLSLLLFGAVGCSRNEAGDRPDRSLAPLMVSKMQRPPQAAGTLSREHSILVDVPELLLPERFARVTDRCTADSEHHCTVLQSDLSSGQSPSSLLKVRTDPSAVEGLLAFAASQGKLVHRSTSVEDLADTMQDTQSRLDMLTTYRKQLLDLQAKANTNIDAAIKIASELSTVQRRFEDLAGGVTERVSKCNGEFSPIICSCIFRHPPTRWITLCITSCVLHKRHQKSGAYVQLAKS